MYLWVNDCVVIIDVHRLNIFYCRSNQQLTVVVGTNHLQSGGVAYPVAKALYHPNYNQQDIYNDVALIKVSTPIQFNNLVKTISLAGFSDPGGSEAVLSGWGKVVANGAVSEVLKFDIFQTLSVQECANRLAPNKIFTTEICAYAKVNDGACQGDSGGPLVINGVQHGITSWVIPCAVGRPDVYTRVYSFLDWIDATIKSN